MRGSTATAGASIGTSWRRVAVVVAPFALVLAACGWPQLGGNAEHSGSVLEGRIGPATVASMRQAWSSDSDPMFHVTGSPIVVGRRVFVEEWNGNSSWRLAAFDAAGLEGCAGSPRTCAPLWTMDARGIPAVVNGVVIASTWWGLAAFDASGTNNCSGNPKVCTPLWTYDTGADVVGTSAPVVSGATLFVRAGATVKAFDALGVVNCAGNTPVCAPLRVYNVPNGVDGDPAVSGPTIFLSGADGNVYGASAVGNTVWPYNCSTNGSPRVCNPMWVGITHGGAGVKPTAVGNARVYVADGSQNKLVVFDAAGCAIVPGDQLPVSCEPWWTASTQGPPSGVAVYSNGVWVTTSGSSSAVQAFDALAEVGCTVPHGFTGTCDPLVTLPSANPLGPPILAGGVLFAQTYSGPLFENRGVVAFKQAGPYVCSTAPPFLCDADWSAELGTRTADGRSLAVANGTLFTGAGDGRLRAFTPAP